MSSIFVAPGHGGPAMVANTYLEGTYSELNPDISLDEQGMRKLFRQFSFPGGIPSHVAPDVPGSVHEGGELGYALSHAYGAAFDNPDLVVACVVGDGEAETGPLSAAWHSNKFLNPARDGAVLPILHLNGYKIANPTILARIPEDELRALFIGYGYEPLFVEGDDPAIMHELMATVLDDALDRIRAIQDAARHGAVALVSRPKWPMIVLRSPKGWTGPKEVDGLKTEGFWRAHQVPLSGLAENPAHLKLLEEWLKSYRPDELFDEAGAPLAEIRATAPQATRRMSANPHANGGLLRRSLDLPVLHDHAIAVARPGAVKAESTRVMGKFLRGVMELNDGSKNFRNRWPGRDRLEQASGRVRSYRARLDGNDPPRRRSSRPRWQGSRNPFRAYLPGLARRLPIDRAARSVLLLRSVHSHCGFHVQPACEMAGCLPGHTVAADRSHR